MASITVRPLSTSNTMPTITGTVDFERFDAYGKPKQTIQIYVNYNKYKLFDGNLGLDESVKPNVWKLHFSSPLLVGSYDIVANVIDINSNLIVASDNTVEELRITQLPVVTYSPQQPRSNPLTILGKLALVQGLMNGLGQMFGGQNGIGDNPSVHPAQDDQISTHLGGRGAQERNEHPTVKDKEKRQKKMTVPYPVPRPAEFKSTKPAGADAALAKAQEALGGGAGLDAAFEQDNSFNDKIDETEKVLAEAQAKTDAMNQTFDAAVEANGGDMTKTLTEQNPGGTGNAATDVGSVFG
jgi:hypothetical protein